MRGEVAPRRIAFQPPMRNLCGRSLGRPNMQDKFSSGFPPRR
jgi:hypothetical protein